MLLKNLTIQFMLHKYLRAGRECCCLLLNYLVFTCIRAMFIHKLSIGSRTVCVCEFVFVIRSIVIERIFVRVEIYTPFSVNICTKIVFTSHNSESALIEWSFFSIHIKISWISQYFIEFIGLGCCTARCARYKCGFQFSDCQTEYGTVTSAPTQTMDDFCLSNFQVCNTDITERNGILYNSFIVQIESLEFGNGFRV